MPPRLRTAFVWGYFLVLLATGIFLWREPILGGLARFEVMGWDFLSLYTGAHMAIQKVPVYHLAEQIEWQNRLIYPGQVSSGGLPFYYPPTMLALLLPFALLPLASSYFAWMGFCGLLLAGFFFLMRWELDLDWMEQATFLLACFSFLPLSIHLMQGQTALIVLLGLALAYVALRRGREFWAGLALSLGFVKPQLVLPLVLVLLWKRRWSALLGSLVGGVALLLPSLPLLGVSGYVDYARISLASMGWQGDYGVFPGVMHNWRGVATRLLGAGALAGWLLVVLSLVSLAVLIWLWWGDWRPAGAHFPLQFAATVLLTALVSPHLNFHDLVLWFLPGALAAYGSIPLTQNGKTILHGLILFGCAAPWLTMLTPGIPAPLTVLAAVGVAGALVVFYWRSGRGEQR